MRIISILCISLLLCTGHAHAEDLAVDGKLTVQQNADIKGESITRGIGRFLDRLLVVGRSVFYDRVLIKSSLDIQNDGGDVVRVTPAHLRDYANISWMSQDGIRLAHIGAHEEAANGDNHSHFHVYTRNHDSKCTAQRCAESRLYIDGRRQNPRVTVTNADLYLKDNGEDTGRLVMQGDDGRMWRVRVNEHGQVVAERNKRDYSIEQHPQHNKNYAN